MNSPSPHPPGSPSPVYRQPLPVTLRDAFGVAVSVLGLLLGVPLGLALLLVPLALLQVPKVVLVGVLSAVVLATLWVALPRLAMEAAGRLVLCPHHLQVGRRPFARTIPYDRILRIHQLSDGLGPLVVFIGGEGIRRQFQLQDPHHTFPRALHERCPMAVRVEVSGAEHPPVAGWTPQVKAARMAFLRKRARSWFLAAGFVGLGALLLGGVSLVQGWITALGVAPVLAFLAMGLAGRGRQDLLAALFPPERTGS